MTQKTLVFDTELQHLASLGRLLSHPARLAILKYLAQQKSCMSGNIAEELPLSRTTVSQHLQELKKGGLIKGEIEGTRVNYCLNPENMLKVQQLFALFFQEIKQSSENCDC